MLNLSQEQRNEFKKWKEEFKKRISELIDFIDSDPENDYRLIHLLNDGKNSIDNLKLNKCHVTYSNYAKRKFSSEIQLGFILNEYSEELQLKLGLMNDMKYGSLTNYHYIIDLYGEMHTRFFNIFILPCNKKFNINKNEIALFETWKECFKNRILNWKINIEEVKKNECLKNCLDETHWKIDSLVIKKDHTEASGLTDEIDTELQLGILLYDYIIELAIQLGIYPDYSHLSNDHVGRVFDTYYNEMSFKILKIFNIL